MMEKSELIRFILANHKHLTLSDISAETGVNSGSVHDTCKRLNVKPISVIEQNKAYVLQMHHFKTLGQMAKSLGIKHEKVVAKICAELGVVPYEHKEPDTRWQIGTIMSGVKLAEAKHYVNIKTAP